ncbi:MAG TPA: hypothetical protein VGP66_08325 [Candidatus Acidoferrum sp.]|jgi:hypothetical protein|nr:hypothetical protein [Candidatus Acidoferrum sp.]
MCFELRRRPRGPAKCDENNGCVQVRQESNPRRVNRSNVFSTVSANTAPKTFRLAYAFSMRYMLGFGSGTSGAATLAV